MKILVTGGCGFIGSAVVRQAISEGHNIMNVDLLSYAGRQENLSTVWDRDNYSFVQMDIRERDAVDKIFSSYSPDKVMHLAAESHVDRSIEGPENFITTNVLGTFNMLEASRLYWEKNDRPQSFVFHHISTDEVYGSLPLNSESKFFEDTAYNPRSPYSASKAGADHLVGAWTETYSLPAIITNCSNNYGPFQFPEKLIPLMILNAIDGLSLPVYGDGSNVRDWLYVEDHADALLLALTKGRRGDRYNIGGNSELSNLQVVECICKILEDVRPQSGRKYRDLITYVDDRPGHDIRYAVDASKIHQELGWEPKVNFLEGLERTVLWYLDNADWRASIHKTD